MHSDQAQEREKSYETIITDGQTQYVKMTGNADHKEVPDIEKS